MDRHGVTFSAEAWSRLDGFSTSSVLMTFFPNVSLEATPGVPGWQDMAVSLDPDCPTVLLDAETGERLAHFAELDYSTEVSAGGERQAGEAGRAMGGDGGTGHGRGR